MTEDSVQQPASQEPSYPEGTFMANYSANLIPRPPGFDGTNHDELVRYHNLIEYMDKLYYEDLRRAVTQPDRGAQVTELLAFGDRPLAPRQIVQIAQELSFRGADEEVIRFLDAQQKLSAKSGTAEFFASPEVMQWRAAELEKAGHNEEARKLSDEILDKDPRNAEALRTRTMARAKGAGENRVAALKEFEGGFAKTGDYSLGMGAMNAALETGDIAKAQQYAKLTSLAARNVGADQSKSFWPALINAQSAAVGGDEAEARKAMLHLVEVLGGKNENGSPVASDVDKLKALDRIEKIIAAQPDRPELKTLLNPVAERLEMSLGRRPQQDLPYQAATGLREAFEKGGSTSRAGMAAEGALNRGNVRLGGALADTAVARRDKMQFLEVAKTPLKDFIESGLLRKEDLPPGVEPKSSLSGIGDVETRIRASQAIARAIYDVDGRKLENLHGPDHKIYDAVVQLRLEHSGATSLSHLSEAQQKTYADLKNDWPLYKAVRDGTTLSEEQRQKLSGLSASGALGADPVEGARKLVKEAELFRTSDTRTNIAVSAAEGIGDCRHVAAATEALVSAVQQDNAETYLRQAARSLAQGDAEGYRRSTAAADRELNGYEIRTYDQEVSAKVEVAELYKPVLTADGKFVAAAPGKEAKIIETHQHDVARIVGADGKERYIVADSFYQKDPYKMSWVDGQTPEVFPGKDLDKKDIDRLRLSGGEVEAVVCRRKPEPDGELEKDVKGNPIPHIDEKTGRPKTVKVPVKLESTEFSRPDRNQVGTPSPEARLNGRAREQDQPSLKERLLDKQRNAQYVVEAEFVAKAGAFQDPESKAVISGLKDAPRKAPAAPANDAERTPEETRGARGAVAKPQEPSEETRGNAAERSPAEPAPSGERASPKAQPAETAVSAGEHASALYGVGVQAKVAVDSYKKAKEAVTQGRTTEAAAEGANAAVNAGSAVVGAALLTSEYYEKLAKLAQRTHLGKAGEILGVAADLTNATNAYITGKNKEEALDKAASSLGQAALTRAAIGVGGIGATGFVTAAQNSQANYETRAGAQAALDRIGADTGRQGNLRGALEALRKETVTDPATKKETPAHPELQALARDARGDVDLADPANQKKIRGVLETVDRTLTKTVDANSDKFVFPLPVVGNVNVSALDGQHSRQDALSDAGRDPEAYAVASAALVQRKLIQVSLAELDNAADAAKFTQAAGRTPAEKHDDVVLAQRRAGGVPEEKVLVTTTGAGGRLTQDDRKQPLPPEMLAAYKADPGRNLTWEVPLYKKDEQGKPVLDDKGRPEVGKIMRYEIVVPGGEKARPSGSQWSMTQKEQLSAFGGTWRAELTGNVEDLHKQFLEAKKAYEDSGKKAPATDVIDKANRYLDGLNDLKARAKSVGLDEKEVDARLKNATGEFRDVFSQMPLAPPQAAAAAPSIFNYKNLPAVAYVLKTTPDSALNGKPSRTPDGFIKNFRDLDMADPKNLKAFEDALGRQIQKVQKSIDDKPLLSSFLPGDKFRKTEDAKIELQQLERARADMEKFKKDLQDFRDGAGGPQQDPQASKFQSPGQGSAGSSQAAPGRQADPAQPQRPQARPAAAPKM